MFKNLSLISIKYKYFIFYGIFYLLGLFFCTKYQYIGLADAFSALTIFYVGLAAIFLYSRQKSDERKDAALIVLSEIRNAERMIEQIRLYGPRDGMKLLSGGYWERYDYMLVSDLDTDEIDCISNFYKKCEALDGVMGFIIPRDQISSKADMIQGRLIDLALEIASESKNEDITVEDRKNEYEKKKEEFLKIVHAESYSFLPSIAMEEFSRSLSTLNNVSTITAGMKLKRIARI